MHASHECKLRTNMRECLFVDIGIRTNVCIYMCYEYVIYIYIIYIFVRTCVLGFFNMYIYNLHRLYVRTYMNINMFTCMCMCMWTCVCIPAMSKCAHLTPSSTKCSRKAAATDARPYLPFPVDRTSASSPFKNSLCGCAYKKSGACTRQRLQHVQVYLHACVHV